MLKIKGNTDFYASVFMGIIATVFWLQLPKLSNRLDVVFPRFILIVMTILTIILFVKSIMKPSVKEIFAVKYKHKVILMLVFSVLWLLIFPHLGVCITSILVLTLLSFLLGEDKSVKKFFVSFLISAITVSIVYYIFRYFLEVRFPESLLW